MARISRTLELLAPARDAATAIVAVDHGADAVYIGAPAFGARAAATNSLEDLETVVNYAHRFGARVYATVNTIIYDSELAEAESMIWKLWQIGVDALIVQDMALLEMKLPPIQLHASTQTDARTPEKISFLAKAGFSQIVVPREFSLEQIRESVAIAQQYGSTVEAFVHGALCVSYSGDCHAGAVLAERSANRGECPQVCRLKFTLTDAKGRPVRLPDGSSPQRHWLSLADMNRIDYLGELADAGVSSFKIEGRLKNAAYVKNVVSAYSRALDDIVAASDGRYRRSSYGRVIHRFTPRLDKSFNRGYTGYFITSCAADTQRISSWSTPKWIGEPIGTVVECNGRSIRLKLRKGVELHNGDGIGFFNRFGEFDGIRANRIEGSTMYFPAGRQMDIPRGIQIYRNGDPERDSLMARSDTATRVVDIDVLLRRLPDGRIVAEATDVRGCHATVASEITYSEASTSPQSDNRQKTFSKLGNTIYNLHCFDDRLGDIFIPSKDLTALRRKLVEALNRAWDISFVANLRKSSSLDARALEGLRLDYHWNVANRLAEQFYAKHGAAIEAKALEITPISGEQRVMTTRYCLRRSLGCCLKTPAGNKLPSDLWLDAPIGRMRIKFDCAKCNMKIYTNPKYPNNGKN